jgi:hypothetical protein
VRLSYAEAVASSGGGPPFEEDLFRVRYRYTGAKDQGYHAALPSAAFTWRIQFATAVFNFPKVPSTI